LVGALVEDGNFAEDGLEGKRADKGTLPNPGLNDAQGAELLEGHADTETVDPEGLGKLSLGREPVPGLPDAVGNILLNGIAYLIHDGYPADFHFAPGRAFLLFLFHFCHLIASEVLILILV